MSFRAQVAADNKSIINADGVAVTLTPPGEDAEPQEITGLVYRIEDQADPLTGERMHAPKTSVHVNASDITGTVTDEWLISTTDVDGTAITGRVVSLRRDYTINMITMIVEVAE